MTEEERSPGGAPLGTPPEAGPEPDVGAPRAPAEPTLRMPEKPVPNAVADARILDLEAQAAEAKQQFQRLAADFDNYRRRMSAEKEELVRFAASRVLENFIPIVDNFERAMAHSSAQDAAAIIKGVDMIFRQVMDFLGKQGVAAMEPVGQAFDPNIHEAIGQVETSDHPDNSVVIQVQKGYFLNGKVLRHAMVQIASNPSAPPPVAIPPEPEVTEEEEPSLDTAAPKAASEHSTNDEFTLEDLMAEANPSEGSKEESHG